MLTLEVVERLSVFNFGLIISQKSNVNENFLPYGKFMLKERVNHL